MADALASEARPGYTGCGFESHLGYQVMRDDKKCPECGTIMQYKHWFSAGADFEGRGGETLYQCPKCKNIEVE